MKDLKVEWQAETPFEVELKAKPGMPAQNQNGSYRVVGGQPTKRIVITESGTVLRQCVRAMQ
jgi:hypothetical protein